MSKIKMGIGKGLFMPEVTVEMFRNAPLEAVEEWLESGEVFDIDLKEEIHREREQAYMQGYEDGRKRLIKLIQNSIEDGEDCSRTMTKQEALEILDTIPTIGEQVDALEMAIEALAKESSEDCISREKVIEQAKRNWFGEYKWVAKEIESLVSNLPSVVPKPSREEGKVTHFIL